MYLHPPRGRVAALGGLGGTGASRPSSPMCTTSSTRRGAILIPGHQGGHGDAEVEGRARLGQPGWPRLTTTRHWESVRTPRFADAALIRIRTWRQAVSGAARRSRTPAVSRRRPPRSATTAPGRCRREPPPRVTPSVMPRSPEADPGERPWPRAQHADDVDPQIGRAAVMPTPRPRHPRGARSRAAFARHRLIGDPNASLVRVFTPRRRGSPSRATMSTSPNSGTAKFVSTISRPAR